MRTSVRARARARVRANLEQHGWKKKYNGQKWQEKRLESTPSGGSSQIKCRVFFCVFCVGRTGAGILRLNVIPFDVSKSCCFFVVFFQKKAKK